jgi:dTDP-4-dehydrorhamnose reductase
VESKKLVVFGSRGQLGVELVSVFQARGYNVAGFDRAKVDICDAAHVAHVFATVDPAIVILQQAYAGQF